MVVAIVAVLNEFLLVGFSLTLRNKPAVASRGLMPSHALARCSLGRPVRLSLSPVGGRIALSPAGWYIAVDGASPLRNILLEMVVVADVVIGRMERVSLRSVWTHEERNFTPWLLENLDLLSGALGIDLHSPSREVPLSGAGRADIVAYVRSDAGDEKAVIENQFGMGDEEHFTRLLGYAEAADASVLVWVASEFSPAARKAGELVQSASRRRPGGLLGGSQRLANWRCRWSVLGCAGGTGSGTDQAKFGDQDPRHQPRRFLPATGDPVAGVWRAHSRPGRIPRPLAVVSDWPFKCSVRLGRGPGQDVDFL